MTNSDLKENLYIYSHHNHRHLFRCLAVEGMLAGEAGCQLQWNPSEFAGHCSVIFIINILL